jgi:hypothetical protein
MAKKDFADIAWGDVMDDLGLFTSTISISATQSNDIHVLFELAIEWM